MKKLLLLAYGLFIASTTNYLLAQEDGVIRTDLMNNSQEFADTLVIKLTSSDKILLIGGNLKDMHKYKQIDSIKTLFVNDITAAQNNNTLTTDATKVYYFITANGKRRLKAENADLSENAVDVNYELKRLQLDLPKYEYHIFDLKNGYQIQVYLTDAKQLKNILETTNIYNAISFANTNAKDDFKRMYKLELNTENGYKTGNKTQGKSDAIMLNAIFGAGIIGNTIAPITGVEAMLNLTNKYSVGTWRAGLNYTVFPFVNSINGDVKNVSLVHSYAVKALFNINNFERGDPFFLGLQVGILKSNDIKSFDNAYKVGLLHQGKTLSYSFDFIKDANKNWVYGLTVYLPF